ncbi:hypothetical protein MMC30_007712 [Trapelia coarctata]|nr:hypothetical protein [Trapelia coarctata]
MRLFLLPISNKRALIYCKRLNIQLTTDQTIVEKVTARATTTWVKWEGAESGWQKTLTGYGNQLFKRIPYEEWGLKSIPPLSARRALKDIEGKEETEVIYPASIIKPGAVFDALQKLATERQALHRKWMWGSIIGMPVTLPFGLIPILPNIPFFYMAFRAWSHWRALSGSQHIEYLLKQGLIKSVPSRTLSSFYALQVVKQWGPTALYEREVLQREYSRSRSQVKNKEYSPKYQKLVYKHRDLTARFRVILAVQEEFFKNNPGAADASAKNKFEELLSVHRGLIEQLEASVNFLLRITPDDALAADSNIPMEDLDEQMLFSQGQGAEIAKHLTNYEGASELVVEVDRAIEQVQKSLLAKKELEAEKQELESATSTKTVPNDVKPKQ